VDQGDEVFVSGAIRSKAEDGVRFDLIHPVALIALARVCDEGASKYGEHNWERGMSVTVCINHAMAHYAMFLAGDRTEPHLEHAAWNAMAAIVSMTLWPGLNGDLRDPGCVLTTEMVAKQERMDADLAILRATGAVGGFWSTEGLERIQKILNARA
jgi:hypothetical protein